MGFEGQSRIAEARVVIAGSGVACEIAARSLAAAGVGGLRLMCERSTPGNPGFARALTASNPELHLEFVAWPDEKATGETEHTDDVAWREQLVGTAAAILYGIAGPSTSSILRAAARQGVPAVAMLSQTDGIRVISFRGQEPCSHVGDDRAFGDVSQIPGRTAARPTLPGHDASDDALGVVAGHLAAAEALVILCEASTPRSRARAIHLPFDTVASASADGAPRAVDIPWTPECVVCGGSGKEMSIP